MHLAKRIVNVAPSATLAISNLTKQMKAAGEDVIDLSIGQPDFPTPKPIAEAAKAAIDSGAASYYLPTTGLPALREAISARIAAQNHVHYDPSQIVVTTGAKFALYSLFQVLLDPGDDVLIPVPYWVSYVEMVRLASATPRLVNSSAQNFKVSVDDLEAARTPHTRAIVLNSPQNPTGAMYTRTELTQIGNWALKHDILVVADEIYRDLVYNGANFTSMVAIDPAISVNTVLIGGVSKSYAMTGWRIGYAAGPAKLMKAMGTLLGHSTGNATAAAQYAAIEAFGGSQAPVETMRQAFEQRLNLIYPLIQQIPGFELLGKPSGAFYLFANVKRAAQLTNFGSVDDLLAAILKDAGVALVPGRAFGLPDYARLSYAASVTDLTEAAKRLSAYIHNN